jgi:hypothetical protein
MKYYIKVTRTYATKNKLEKAIYEALIKHDGTLLEKKFLSTFKNELINTVEKLNSEHQRCQAKELRYFSPTNNSMQFYVSDVIYIDAYPVKIES